MMKKMLFIAALILLILAAPALAEDSDGLTKENWQALSAIVLVFGIVLFACSFFSSTNSQIFIGGVGGALIILGIWGVAASQFLRA
jgi:hypothetical protein